MKNNWDEIGKKISGYTPDEYTPQDWDAMDDMLSNGLVKKQWYYINTLIKGLGAVAVLVIGGYFIFQKSFQSNEEINKLENIVSVEKGENENIETPLLNATDKNIVKSDNESTDENPEREINVSSINSSKKNDEENDVNIGNKKVDKNITNEKLNVNKEILSSREKGNSSKEKGQSANKSGVKSAGNSGSLNSPLKDDNSNSITEKGSGLNARNKMRLDVYAPIEEVAKSDLIGSENKNNATSKDAIFALPLLEFPVLNYHGKIGLETNNISAAVVPVNKASWGKIRFGAMLGMNATVTDYSSMSTSTLPLFGVFANKRIKEKLELQVEMHVKFVDNYDVKAEWEDVVYGSSGIVGAERVTQQYRRFTSLDVPVVLKYNSSSRIGFLGGARFSYLGLGQNGAFSSFSTNGIGAVPLSERVPQYGFWKYDVNLVLGVECYIASRWVVDLRYNQGFLDITPDNLYQDKATHLNSDLQFSLRYIF